LDLGEDLVDARADGLARLVSEHARRAGVPGEHATVRGDAHDRVVRPLDDRREVLARDVGALLLGDVHHRAARARRPGRGGLGAYAEPALVARDGAHAELRVAGA